MKKRSLNNVNLDVFYRGNYLNSSISCLKNVIIREFDMKSAGFSMIKAHKLLSSETIEYLESISSDKLKLNIEIGLIRKKDVEFSEKLAKCIRETVFQFLVKNEIHPDNLLSIKNDAVFIIGKDPIKLLEINGGIFTLDHIFTSYYFINSKEFYFNSNTSEIVIKGLGNEVIETHMDYIIYEFKYIFQQAEFMKYDDLLNEIKRFKEDYLSRSLEIECYRELNGDNDFKFISVSSTRDKVYSHKKLNEKISEIYINKIDISFNYIHYILPLMSLLLK